jgi:hypothetical protein
VTAQERNPAILLAITARSRWTLVYSRRNLPLERGAVGTMLGHGFHPLKAQHPWSIQKPHSVHPEGRTPKGDLLSKRFDMKGNQHKITIHDYSHWKSWPDRRRRLGYYDCAARSAVPVWNFHPWTSLPACLCILIRSRYGRGCIRRRGQARTCPAASNIAGAGRFPYNHGPWLTTIIPTPSVWS